MDPFFSDPLPRAGVPETCALWVLSPREAPLHQLVLLIDDPRWLHLKVFVKHVIPREAIAWLGLRPNLPPRVLCLSLSPPSLSPRFRRATVLCL